MGNCLKKNFIFGNSHLLDPLINSYELEETSITSLLEKITKLEIDINTLKSKVELLENNTQDNLKTISKDLNYINTKIVSNS
jgi:hypothetical protein